MVLRLLTSSFRLVFNVVIFVTIFSAWKRLGAKSCSFSVFRVGFDVFGRRAFVDIWRYFRFSQWVSAVDVYYSVIDSPLAMRPRNSKISGSPTICSMSTHWSLRLSRSVLGIQRPSCTCLSAVLISGVSIFEIRPSLSCQCGLYLLFSCWVLLTSWPRHFLFCSSSGVAHCLFVIYGSFFAFSNCAKKSLRQYRYRHFAFRRFRNTDRFKISSYCFLQCQIFSGVVWEGGGTASALMIEFIFDM